MSDPGSFTSLMDLVESHLSKTSLQARESGSGEAGASFSLADICGVRGGSSASLVPPPSADSDVTQVLALQLRNMLAARDCRLRRDTETLALRAAEPAPPPDDQDDYVIDLTASIIAPGSSAPRARPPALSHASSLDSLLSDTTPDVTEPKEVAEELPLCQDLSHILFQKIKKGRCSEFGKVLCARYRPVAAPYLKSKITNPKVVPFDFSTPSPCDINKEKRKHPPPDPYAHMNMVDRFMAMTKDEA